MEKPVCDRIIACAEGFLKGDVPRITIEIDLPALTELCFDAMAQEDAETAERIRRYLITEGADAGAALDDGEFYALIKEKLRLVKAEE